MTNPNPPGSGQPDCNSGQTRAWQKVHWLSFVWVRPVSIRVGPNPNPDFFFFIFFFRLSLDRSSSWANPPELHPFFLNENLKLCHICITCKIQLYLWSRNYVIILFYVIIKLAMQTIVYTWNRDKTDFGLDTGCLSFNASRSLFEAELKFYFIIKYSKIS